MQQQRTILAPLPRRCGADDPARKQAARRVRGVRVARNVQYVGASEAATTAARRDA